MEKIRIRCIIRTGVQRASGGGQGYDRSGDSYSHFWIVRSNQYRATTILLIVGNGIQRVHQARAQHLDAGG